MQEESQTNKQKPSEETVLPVPEIQAASTRATEKMHQVKLNLAPFPEILALAPHFPEPKRVQEIPKHTKSLQRNEIQSEPSTGCRFQKSKQRPPKPQSMQELPSKQNPPKRRNSLTNAGSHFQKSKHRAQPQQRKSINRDKEICFS